MVGGVKRKTKRGQERHRPIGGRRLENDKEAQGRKEDSIAFFNSTNSAIALLKESIGTMDNGDLKVALKEWREWFLSEYETYKRGF